MSATSIQHINPGKLKSEIESGYAEADKNKAGQRLYERDASLWKTDAENVKSINNRLGWLDLATDAKDLIAFAGQIKSEGYKHAVLLGMGGSSLCSEVARETFGSKEGYPELLVLDNTAPAAITALQKQIDITKTLFITASKSGGTMETLSFYKYFYAQLQGIGFANPGANFVAITDAATPLVKIAEEKKFRKVFVNRGDIGGRYSVLSDFGLLPMALMGIDIETMLLSTEHMRAACSAPVLTANNPGVSLGVALGIANTHGRDKVTFVMSNSIKAFGYWVEQLIAESTGKEGKGLIPVTGETLGAPDVYGADRVFIHMYLNTDDNTEDDKKLAVLEKAGNPVIKIKVADKLALGGEYYRWEVATAIAGYVIGINPFNEPNVAEGKKNTSDLLEEWSKNGSFKKPDEILSEQGLSVYGTEGAKSENLKNLINQLTSAARAGDYISLLCYFTETKQRTSELETWRIRLRDKTKLATTLAYGPRYLHSTGQLHKGGPGTGIYIILTGSDEQSLPIPGEKFGFGILNEGQSLGDFRSLSDKGRKVIYIQLGENIDKGLENLFAAIGLKVVGKN